MGVQAVVACLVCIVFAASSAALSQEISEKTSKSIAIRGTVINSKSEPVSNVNVLLKNNDTGAFEKKLSDNKGAFSFLVTQNGTYCITAEKIGEVSDSVTLLLTASQGQAKTDLVLHLKQASTKTPETSKGSLGEMQFADQPNFTVAGVTDFTAAGGHGSDSALRTSEALAVETANLRPEGTVNNKEAHGFSSEEEQRLRSAVVKDPDSFDANHRLGEFYFQASKYAEAIPLLQSAHRIKREDRENEYHLALACKAIGDPAHSKSYVQELLAHQESGELYRLAAELDESLGDSLAAVREFQKAASLDPSEPNFFAWGSELLVHRAIWQAQQVFEEGAKLYPASPRMLTGLGTALFSGAAYEQAALRLCEASDLKPTDSDPYVFLGKVQMAAPNRLPCIEERLQRFVREQPQSAAANYLYAMALQREEDYSASLENKKRSETFLKMAVALDPKYSEAYLQLGILCASQKDFAQAIDLYKKAIATNPQMSDAYYRLAVAYDRTGELAKAREQFALHDAVAKQQAAETERQRQEIKQFLVVLPGLPVGAQTQ